MYVRMEGRMNERKKDRWMEEGKISEWTDGCMEDGKEEKNE